MTSSTVVVVYADNIQGTSGDDTLNGTPDADTISGLEGNDKILGEGGDDFIDGGSGSDEIYGGDGNDDVKDINTESIIYEIDDTNNKVYGGSGNDNIDVGIASHIPLIYHIYGEAGADYVKMTAGEGYVNGGLDDDIIYCTANQCHIQGNEGHDEIHVDTMDTSPGYSVNGGSGNDKIFSDGGGHMVGGDGNDHLVGGEEIEGGEGDDILEGPANFYKGGPGADTFKCSPTYPYEQRRPNSILRRL